MSGRKKFARVAEVVGLVLLGLVWITAGRWMPMMQSVLVWGRG